MRRLFSLVVVVCVAGCGGEVATQTASSSSQALAESEARSPLFPRDSHPYGKSIERWSELLWSYIYAQPLDHNPFLDTTGADCAVGQEGPVWFLPAVPGSTLGTNITRRCTIPRHRAVLLQLASIMNDYPCPDPTFHPAPGQSLFDFLMAPVTPAIDAVSGFEITLDGVPLKDPLSNRFTSDDLFFFTGNLSLQATFDTCITGTPQPAVSDGYYLMFKPLSPGQHTIVVNGHDMHGTPVVLTEELTIR